MRTKRTGFSENNLVRPSTSLVVLFLILAGCSNVRFDFGEVSQAPPSTDSSVCELIEPVAAICTPGAEQCLNSTQLQTAILPEGTGCTPAKQALAVLEISSPDFISDTNPLADLFVWAMDPDGVAPFYDQAHLAIFGDSCGLQPPGGTLACAYQPWMFQKGISFTDTIFVHAQTPGPETLTLGYQVVPQGGGGPGWSMALPPEDEPLVCGDTSQMSIELDDLYCGHDFCDSGWEWPAVLDLDGAPPALWGSPWICPTASGGWRQAAYLLRNHDDLGIRVSGISLRDREVEGNPVPFHFAIFACDLLTGKVLPESHPLAASCTDEPQGFNKDFEIVFTPWDGSRNPATGFVLVLQVPPGPVTTVYLWLNSVYEP